ncbi:SPOR domain-containing protein [Actinomycetes bacterium NPDC127524]
MDKTDERRKGITIKINGKEKSFIHRESDLPGPEIAAAAEKTEDSFEWILPEDYENHDEFTTGKTQEGKALILSHHNKSGGKTKRNFMMKAPLVSIICAVLCGSLLGFIVLKMITANQGAKSIQPAIQGTAVPVSGKASAALPELKAYLVQGGIFSSEAAAKGIQQRVAQKQIPSEIFKRKDGYYLFLGTAESLDESKKLALFIKSYGADVFWKEVDIKQGSKKMDSTSAASLKEMVSLYHLLSGSSSKNLLGDKSAANSETWAKKTAAVKNLAKNPATDEMKSDVLSAAELLKQYETSRQTSQLLQAQGKLLSFLAGYQKITGS